MRIPVRLFVFDLLAVAGVSTIDQPYHERRAILDELYLGRHTQRVDTFDDGEALFSAACTHGLEGIVAKRLDEPYRPGWRWPTKVESMRRPFERRRRLTIGA